MIYFFIFPLFFFLPPLFLLSTRSMLVSRILSWWLFFVQAGFSCTYIYYINTVFFTTVILLSAKV